MMRKNSRFTAHRNMIVQIPACGNARKLNTKIIADPISRTGYRGLMDCLHWSHFPFCMKKLTSGIRFLALSVAPHFGQVERHRRIHLIVSLSTFLLSLIKSTEPNDQKRSHMISAIIRIVFWKINAITIVELRRKSRNSQ